MLEELSPGMRWCVCVNVSQHFKGTYCVHLLGLMSGRSRDPTANEDEGPVFISSIQTHYPGDTTPLPQMFQTFWRTFNHYLLYKHRLNNDCENIRTLTSSMLFVYMPQVSMLSCHCVLRPLHIPLTQGLNSTSQNTWILSGTIWTPKTLHRNIDHP